jgi:hypothetical protein
MYVKYAVFAAENVLDIYELRYPEDKRPRQAIKAAKKCIENPSDENKKFAHVAAYDAIHAGNYAAAYFAAKSSIFAAIAASQDYAAVAAYIATTCAVAAKAATVDADAMRRKILEYGILLLSEETP